MDAEIKGFIVVVVAVVVGLFLFDLVSGMTAPKA